MGFLDSKEDAPKPVEMDDDAFRALQIFAEKAESPDVIALCDDIVQSVHELADAMGVPATETSLAMLAGLALQRQQVIQTKLEQAEQAGASN